MTTISPLPNIDTQSTETIVNNTENTWEQGRNKEGKFKDTKLGKIAEVIFESYIKENKPEIEYQSYDSFRKNNYAKHAPFDGVIYRKSINRVLLEEFLKKIINEVTQSECGSITDELKLELESNEIFTVEIKSTRVTKRHFQNGEDDRNVFQNIKTYDDFLTYPKFLRIAPDDEKINLFDYYKDYCNNQKGQNINSMSDLSIMERNNMSYYYFRIYIDEANNKAHIMGYIDKQSFSNGFTIKRMYQPGKSEKALYLAKPLRFGMDISQFAL